MLKAGQEIALDLDSLAYGGDAVGRYQGQAVFVPYAAPGDRLRVRITEPHRSYCRAEITQVSEPSGHRVSPECPHFGTCGSCQWQMLEYGYQLEQKAAIARDLFLRLARLDPGEVSALSSPAQWGYRNKAQYPVQPAPGGLRAGYYQSKSHRIVEIEGCPLLRSRLNDAFKGLKSILAGLGIKGYDERHGSGQLRHLLLRYSRLQDAVSLTLVTSDGQDLPGMAPLIRRELPWVRSIWQNVNPSRGNAVVGPDWRRLGGEEYLEEEIGGLRYLISPGSFLQTNLVIAESFYRQIAECLDLGPGETAADLYSGMGSIALQLAGRCRLVTGIEEFPPAVEDAKANARLNGITNCRFLCGRIEQKIAALQRADAVVLDPPRQGAAPGVVKALAGLKPSRIAYLSCNPSTLARDAARLGEEGYSLKKVFLGDMFPHTYHIELLAIFLPGGK